MTRSDEWGTRIAHEASLHEQNSFVTWTYADEHLPADFSVSGEVVQKLHRRIRRAGYCHRFVTAGEYGDDNLRPHYHSIIFGQDWSKDRRLWRMSKSGFPLYRSATLERFWPFGFVEFGDVTAQSGAYVAKYVLKKTNGDRAAEYYRRTHPLTLEVHQVQPEFMHMSTNPGIGSGWYERYRSDAFPSDFVTIDGQKRAIPRYYTKKLQAEDTSAARRDLATVKHSRAVQGRVHADNNTPERLATREELKHINANLFRRNVE